MRLVRLLLLLAVVAIASAVQPRQDSGFIQEQQLLEQHQQEQSHWELGTYRRTGLSASETMSCPSKPQEDGEPKIEWPELQGKTADEAKAVLEKEAPGFKIQVIGPDMMATADYRCERIRIWLNKQQRVSQPPRVG